MKYVLFLLLLVANVNAGLPPTSSKGGNESVFGTTFKFDFGALPVTRNGTQITFGTLPVSGGGTGLTSFNNYSLLTGSGTAINQITPGASGSILISNGASDFPGYRLLTDADIPSPLSNKTLVTPTLSGTVTNQGTVSGGVINNTVITNSTVSGGAVTSATITLGTVSGTTIFDLNKGASGYAPATNLNTNPGFEYNVEGFTATSSTITRTTSATDVAIQTGSGVWSTTASGAILATTAYTVPQSLANQAGVFSFLYRGASNTTIVEVIDGSSNVLATTTLLERTTYNSMVNPTYLGFNFPSSGTVQARLRQPNSGTITTYLDEVYFGTPNNLTQTVLNDWKVDVNIGGTGSPNLGAVAVSSYTELASTNVDLINNSGIGNLTAQIPCTGTNPSTGLTCAGNESIGVVFDLPKGYTDVLACAEFSHNVVTGTVSAGAVNANFQLIETPNNAQTILQLGKSRAPSGFQGTNNTVYMARNVCGTFSFTTSGQKTIRLMYEQQIGGTVLANVIDTSRDGTLGSPDIHIVVYPLKVAQETAIRIGSEAWKVDANIGGANPSIGTVSQTAYVGIENSGLDLVNNPGLGNVAAQIPCSGTNPPTGLTCAAGNESVGVSFNLPEGYQDVLACVSFTVNQAVTTGAINTVFQIIETANNAQTILQEGKTRINAAQVTTNGTSNVPFRVCGNFSFTSAGQKTLRLAYEQIITATATSNDILADRNATLGQRDIHWEVYPLNVGKPQPIILESVTSPNAGGDRIARGRFAGGTSTTNCTASPCTLYNGTTSNVTSVTRSSSGTYTINFSPAFSQPPQCDFTGTNGANFLSYNLNGASTSSYGVSIGISNTGVATDAYIDFNCVGPR